MKVLVIGANGFLGRHIVRALADAGHAVAAGVRRVPARKPADIEYRAVDFNQADDPPAWRDLLAGVDIVVNAVGIFRESAHATFQQLHVRAPQALFAACARAGVRRVIQISALGADAQAGTAYHRSKRAADDYLLSLPLDAVVLQPSLVYGKDGASAALFGALATLPWIPAPELGSARVQPVHVDDVAAAVVALADPARPQPARIALVGPRPLSWRAFLADLRAALGMPGRARFLPVPAWLAAAAARLGAWWPGMLFDLDAWRMLRRGNSADAGAIARLLGRPPRGVRAFIAPEDAAAQRTQATLYWLLPILRLSLACLWIVTGVLSLGIYPVASSYELLARAGVPAGLQPLALYGAALLDIVLGLLVLLPRRTRRLWAAQAALVLGYTAIISWRLPEFWLHPYGPVLKNVPLLAMLWLLYALERPWNTR